MYNHTLVEQIKQQGEPLTAEENLALYLLVRTGDMVARERMITGNLPLTIKWIDDFLQDGHQWLRYFRDDLISAGFYGLVGAVNNLIKGDEIVENPIGYLRRAILAKLYDAIEYNHTIRRPRSGGRARRDENWSLPCVVSIDMENLTVPSETSTIDIRDFIQVCCRNDMERQFIQLKEEKYTCSEIAQITGVHETTVGRAIHRIETEVQQGWLE